MKKTLILVGMLSIGYAQAQEGKVGINTSDPKATLDIQPNGTNLLGNTNEGILAPRLSKARIANIAAPVEGTLVYATDNVYGGNDVKVSDINEKGYYFYNGTKWVKTSAGNAVASNIYTADGSTNGDRTVSTAGGFLTIKGNAWNPLVVNSEIVPADADNTARGGLAVHPNDITKRVEFATTKDGDSRIWADGDRLFIKRATGAVGIGTNTPKAKLQVIGGIRANQGLPNGDDTNLGYAFGNDGDTGLFSEADETNTNIAKSLSLYTNNVNRIFIKNDNGLVGINNTNPKVRLDVIGGGRFKRNGSSSTIEIDTDNNQWGHLDFRRNDVKRWDIGMTNGEETGAEAGSNFFISSFKDDGSFNGSGLFINRQTGNTGLGTDKPQSRLDVAGEIIARGQAQTDAYFGGDNVPAVPGRPMYDVEIGSIKAGVTDISLYNRADATAMNLYANSVNTFGTLQSNSLAGDADKIVIANNDGTLTKGVSISNFATSNIYTADGTLTGNRIVNTGDNNLTIKGNSWFPLIIQSTVDGGTGNNSAGGLAIYADDFNKRIELATTKDGDIRLWGGDGVSKLFIKRASGNTGIGTDEPKAKLDVRGGIRAVQGYPQGDDTNLGYAFGTDGDTGLFSIADPTNNNVGTGLDLYVNNVSRLNINQQGDVKVTNLSGDGDKIVIANNDGTLTKGVSISNFATSNIYTADGTLTGDRTVDQAGKWLDFNNGGIRITGNDGVYFPLSINTKHSGGNGGIVINPNGDSAKRVELNSTPEGDFRLWADGDKIYVNRSTGNVGLSVGTNPAARLDVSGELIARGQTGEIEAYFGGDGVGGDVEVGSIKAGVTDVTLYNRGDSKAMNLVSGNVDARGTIKSTTLSGDGDKIVIANNDGTLVKGVSVNNFATSNIYTADGSTNGDRTVSTANGFLTIKGNAWNPLVVNSEIVPGDPANNSRGGLAVHPNDMEKRVEFATTKDGDSRIWLDGDKVFIKRATGNVGIGTVDPQAKLDVSGSIKSTALVGTGNRNVMADKDGKLVIGEATSNIRTEVGDTMLTESDNNGYVYLTGAGTVTIPSSLPAGFSCIVVQQGDDQVVIAGDGVELQTARGTKTRAKFSAVGIIKRTTDSATITGDAVN